MPMADEQRKPAEVASGGQFSLERLRLERLALAGQAARQLGHELSNFLYNLSLQIEIWESTQDPSTSLDWTPIKRESQRMARLLREWQELCGRGSETQAVAVDLHQLIHCLLEELSRQHPSVRFVPSVGADPLCVNRSPVDTKHLFRLLIEQMCPSPETEREANSTISIQTQCAVGGASVAIIGQHVRGPATGETDSHESSEPALVAATCRSLAVRLDASLHEEQTAGDRLIVQVIFRSIDTGT